MILAFARPSPSATKVLVEVNGMRIWSSTSNPLVDDFPWVVESNDFEQNGSLYAGHLVVRHPRFKQPLRLDYSQMLHNQRNQPCVFIETHPEIQEGMLYVILQMVAFLCHAQDGPADVPHAALICIEFIPRAFEVRSPANGLVYEIAPRTERNW